LRDTVAVIARPPLTLDVACRAFASGWADFNDRRFDEVVQRFTEDCVLYDHRGVPWDPVRGRDGLVRFYEQTVAVWPDVEIRGEVVEVSGPNAATTWTTRGVQPTERRPATERASVGPGAFSFAPVPARRRLGLPFLTDRHSPPRFRGIAEGMLLLVQRSSAAGDALPRARVK
jgi:hypothetical protein